MEAKKTLAVNAVEQGVNQGIEWKKMSAQEGLDFFRRVIPENLDTKSREEVFKEKVTFVDGKVFDKKEDELAIAFVSSISDVSGEKKMKLSWVSLSGGGDLECGEPINMAYQEVGEKRYVLISQRAVDEEGKNWETIRRFSIWKR
ncbi:MAG: hypothetical protein WC784_01545 [Candidatus Shapirobacteria bacterium]|jgi:hypothetical protein